MFAKGKSAQAGNGASGLSFIGPEAVVSGGFATTAHLHVDGRIDGGVRCGTLIQGEKGAIAGDITAEEARIAGLVEGTVHARMVIIGATARITGDVAYETISIAPGGQIEGRLARRGALTVGEEVPALLITTDEEVEREPRAVAQPARKKRAGSRELFPEEDEPQRIAFG